MMVSGEEILNGLLLYIDGEVMPKLATSGKIALGSMIFAITTRGDSILNRIQEVEALKLIGVIDDEGKYDIDLITSCLNKSMDKYGKLQLNVPIIGTLSFNSDDITKARKYIKGDDINDKRKLYDD